MDNADESMDNWRQFQGTELGSLLGSIYGSNRPKINYPKPKTKPVLHDKLGFLPGGAKLDAVDPRKATRRDVKIAVPKVSGRTTSEEDRVKPIDYISRRKGINAIQLDIDDIKMRQEHYRPAFTKPIAVDAEKDRLSQIFAFKGGKGLPEELTMPVGEAPFEARQRKKEAERLDTIRQKRGLMVVRSSSQRALSNEEQFAQQIQHEIDDRTQHLEEMRRIGIKPQQEQAMMRDLAQRVGELNRLHTDM